MRSGVDHIVGVYAIADDAPGRRNDLRSVASAALAAGARVIQLRLKHTCDGDALAVAEALLPEVHRAGALLIVNDRLDIAVLAGADGIHLGTDDLPPEQIPPALRARLLVGLSTHTAEQVEASCSRPVDYIGFGPVFGTTSKQSEYDPRGLVLLEQAVGISARPVVAIGGIGLAEIEAVAAAGAAAAAVIGAIADANDPRAAAAGLAAGFGAGQRSRAAAATPTPRPRSLER